VCGSILLHTGIAIMMGLVAFSLFMLVLVFSFVPPDAVRGVLDQLQTRLKQWSKKPVEKPSKQSELVLSGR
jgi:hypothetical protein